MPQCFSQSSSKFPLTSVLDKGNNYPVKASVLINTTQNRSNLGIKYTLLISNTSNDSIQLTNPLDLLSITLLDTNNRNLIPQSVSRVLINDKEKRKHFIPIKGVDLEKISQNKMGAKIDPDSDVIVMPPLSDVEYIFSIKKVKNYSKNIIENASETPLKIGTYRLTLFLGLAPINIGRFNKNTQLKPITLRTQILTIYYKN